MKKLLTICAFASMTLASTAQDYQTGISLENLNLKANPAEDFFEYACGLSGYLLDVNPFDQPGVEAYKRNMFALLGKPGYEAQRAALEEKLSHE